MYKFRPVIFIIFAGEAVAGLVLLVIGFFTDPSEMLDKDMPLKTFFLLLGIVLFIGPVVAAGFLYTIGNFKKKQSKKLKNTDCTARQMSLPLIR
jgi:hypothetical protein